MTVTILLADDHTILRQGLRALLETQPDFEVIGEAGTGLEAIQLTEKLKPDVLVLDIMLPDLSGLEVARQIGQRYPKVKIVILSMHAKEGYVLEALKSGVAAYVLKDSQASELVQAVQAAVVGRRYLSPPLSERAIEAYIAKSQDTSLDPYETLTGREREILSLTAQGLNNSEIAARLVISPRTVEIHRSNMLRKLELRTQTDVVRYALKRGIIPEEQ